MDEKEKIYKKTWFAILMLFVFAPVGLSLLWKYAKPNKPIRIFIVAFFCIGIPVAIIAGNKNTPVPSKSVPAEAKVSESANENVQKIIDAVGCSEEQAENIYNKVSLCGLDTIDKIVFFADDDEIKGKIYEMECSNILGEYKDSFMLDIDQYYGVNQLNFKLRLNVPNLIEYGESKYVVSDLFLTSEEFSNYRVATQSAVEKILKSPKTADFPNKSDWKIWKKDGNVYVRSYVDAENTFGANLRSEFQLTYDNTNGNITSFIFDGEELFK